METLEISAKSVNEAVDLALEKLDAKLSEVEIVILSEGRAGILGVGAEDARIRVTKLDQGRARLSNANFPPRPPIISYQTSTSDISREMQEEEDEDQGPPPPLRSDLPERSRPERFERERPQRRPSYNDRPERTERAAPAPAAAPSYSAESRGAAKAGQEVLQELLQSMGFEAELIEIAPPIPSAAMSDLTVAFDVRGDDLGLLIGRRGQTLSSLQFLVNLMVNRRLRNSALIVVDVEGYRGRRYSALRGLAERMADRVRKTGQPVTLEPMNAAERRIIHMSLQDRQDVTTQSSGEGENRKVSIIPKRR